MLRQIQNHKRLALRNLSARIDYAHATLPQRLTLSNKSQTIVTQGLTYINREQSIATIEYNEIHDKFPYTVPLCSRYLQAVYHTYTNSGITPHRTAKLTSLQNVS
jgi:hypothetical protein